MMVLMFPTNTCWTWSVCPEKRGEKACSICDAVRVDSIRLL
jgi:hypothetical protein